MSIASATRRHTLRLALLVLVAALFLAAVLTQSTMASTPDTPAETVPAQHVAAVSPSDLEGLWYNELGSVMELRVNGGALEGYYQTGVGNASGRYPLTGRLDTAPLSHTIPLGFAVGWVNDVYGSSHSVTTWSGQYQIINGEPVITTMWFLTRATTSSSNWASTNVGQNIFRRTPASQAAITENQQTANLPYPLEISQ